MAEGILDTLAQDLLNSIVLENVEIYDDDDESRISRMIVWEDNGGNEGTVFIGVFSWVRVGFNLHIFEGCLN